MKGIEIKYVRKENGLIEYRNRRTSVMELFLEERER
jgi:hypothetical protein